MNYDFSDTLARFSALEFTQWLINSNLIKENQICLLCNKEMLLSIDTSTSDGVKWKCTYNQCTKKRTTLSIRTGSWMANFKIPLKSIIKSIILWSRKLTFVDISKAVQISAPVYIRLRNYLLSKISDYYIENPVRLGGPRVIVQVDETKLNHNVKSHRGRGPIRPAWCLCITDTSSQPATGFATMIPDRTAATIIPIIKRVVRSGSIIHSDEARVYQSLKQNYEHSSVCHKYNFVDPITGVHTQHVESWNNKIKNSIKKVRGVDEDKREDFLKEYMFLEKFKNSAFEQIILLLTVN